MGSIPPELYQRMLSSNQNIAKVIAFSARSQGSTASCTCVEKGVVMLVLST